MNIAKKFFSMAALGSLAMVFNACGGGGGGAVASDDVALRDYLGSTEAQSDLEDLAEFAFYSEYLQVAPIVFLAGDDGLYTDNVDENEANEYADVMARVLSKVDDYEAAWGRIDSMKALETETPKVLKKVGLLYSMRDFFRSLRGCGKGTREKAMAVAGELDKSQLKTLFDGLDPNQKRGETDHLTWWKNFNNGDYDDISLQIYNRMYYNTETSFADEAEFINKTVAKTGAELSKKAGEFQVEILKAAFPSSVTDAMDKIETMEKVNKVVTKGKDMSAEELKDNIASILIDDYDDVKKVSEMAGEDVEAISNLTKKVIDKVTASSEETSKVTFADEAASAMDGGKIAIAIGVNSAKVTIALGTNENGDQQITLREGGEHVVSFLNGKGDKFTQKIESKLGENVELKGKINEKEIRDAKASSSSISWTSKSSSSIKPAVKSSSSVEESSSSKEESSSSMEISKDAKSIYGRWVAAKDLFIYKVTDEDQCLEVKNAMAEIYKGLNEIADFMSEDCENKEVPQNTISGQKMLFYSDGTLDCLDGSGNILGSYSYSFEESTGVFTYDDGDGNKSTGQVSADGSTLIFETVTDMGYKTITHRVVFEKESGDIEYFGDD